jgi:ABC-type oligopeptide transport system ATPase subunit
MSAPPLLSVRGLCKRFPVRTGAFSGSTRWLRAVDEVSFDISAGETRRVGLRQDHGWTYRAATHRTHRR